jgi:hypothetical protein
MEKIFGEKWGEIKKFNLNASKSSTYHSILIPMDYQNEPIRITHSNKPMIEELVENDEIIQTKFDDEYILGGYKWTEIRLLDIPFTDLKQRDELGDCILITSDGIFKLLNTKILESYLFYEEAVMLNN